MKDHLGHDRRLILPVGACDQHGPHLPIGASTLVSTALARDLAQDFGVLCAPVLSYGVNVPAPEAYAGAAGLHEKTLHRAINDLLTTWEDQGFQEFIVLTAHDHDAHGEALANVTTRSARVRVIEALAIDLSTLLGTRQPRHDGEVMTSLMLYLHPEKVNLAVDQDFALPDRPASSLSHPSRGTREAGEKIYQYILQRIRAKVFLASEAEED